MARRLGHVVLALLVAISSSRAAEAAPRTKAPSQQEARALELFEESAQSYRDGRFQDAVDKLLEARKLKPEPVLLYNLGRAYEALGRSQDAADAYSAYLSEEPGAKDRKAIEGRVATLRAQAAANVAPPPATPAPPPPAPAPAPDKSVLPWIVVGAGAAATGVGLVVGVLAQGQHSDAVDDPVQRSAVEKQDDAESLARVSTVTMIAGGVVVLAGLAWLVVRSTTPRRSTAANAPLQWSF